MKQSTVADLLTFTTGPGPLMDLILGLFLPSSGLMVCCFNSPFSVDDKAIAAVALDPALCRAEQEPLIQTWSARFKLLLRSGIIGSWEPSST